MDVIKKLCCSCFGSDESSVPYERMPSEDVRAVRNPPRRATNSITEQDGPRSPTSSADSPATEQVKTVAEREKEALNQILQNAQESVIDVAHLHTGGLSTHEYIERAREYEEAILTHNVRIKGMRGGQPPVKVDLPGPSTGRRLLDDCGSKAVDLLGRNPISQAQYHQGIDSCKKMADIVKGIKVVPKQELLITMDF